MTSKVEITDQALKVLVDRAKSNELLTNFSGKLERFVDAVGAKWALASKAGETINIMLSFDE